MNGMFTKGIEFHKNGKFKYRGTYKRCKPDFKGFNVEYFPNGQILRMGECKVKQVEEKLIEEKKQKKKETEPEEEIVFEGVEYSKEGIEKEEMERGDWQWRGEEIKGLTIW